MLKAIRQKCFLELCVLVSQHRVCRLVLRISPQRRPPSSVPDLWREGTSVSKSRDIRKEQPTHPKTPQPNPPPPKTHNKTHRENSPTLRSFKQAGKPLKQTFKGFAQFPASLVHESEVTGVTQTISYCETQRCTSFHSDNVS